MERKKLDDRGSRGRERERERVRERERDSPPKDPVGISTRRERSRSPRHRWVDWVSLAVFILMYMQYS